MIYHSAFGDILLNFSEKGLTELRFVAKDESTINDHSDITAINNAINHGYSQSNKIESLTISWLDHYFKGLAPDFTPPLDLQGISEFTRIVLDAAMKIKFGQTCTYGDLGRAIGCGSAQAVGQALHRNPILLIIPCHRIVAAHSIGGYAAGLPIKQRMLLHEH